MKKDTIKSKRVFLDHDGQEFDTRAEAVGSNVHFRNFKINESVREQVRDILMKTKLYRDKVSTWNVSVSLEEIADYLVDTDLVKTNKKINELTRKATKQFDINHPDITLK